MLAVRGTPPRALAEGLLAGSTSSQPRNDWPPVHRGELSCDDSVVAAQHSLPTERTVIIGCAGSGKSTLAAQLAACHAVPHLRRDSFGAEGSDQYRAGIAAAVSAERWVFDGAPYYLEDLVYGRATLIVGFDLPRLTVMRRVISRSLRESIGLAPPPLHRDRRWRAWLDSEHPVPWAWATWPDRHHELRDLVASGAMGLATVVLLSTPGGVAAWLEGRSDCGWSILAL